MADIKKVHLDGSTDGGPILITDGATPGQVIHTDSNTTSFFDEVWLYAENSSASDVVLTLEVGGVSDPGDIMEFTIAANAPPTLIVPGFLIDNGLIIAAFAGTTSVLKLSGYVHRIDQT